MSNAFWSEEEIADLRLPWVEFSKLWPERSDSAYRHKRKEVERTRERVKAPVVIETDEIDRLSSAELLEAAIRWQDALNAAFLEAKQHKVGINTDEPIIVAFMSDWHIGSQYTDLRKLQEDCQLIASHPRVYAAIGGDPVDNFIIPGMADAARSQSLQIRVQWRAFAELVDIMLPSVLWVSSGNHDAWTTKLAGIDGVPAALAGMKVVYTGEGAYVDFRVGNQTYTIWRKHKPTRFKSGYNKGHYLKQMLRIAIPRMFDVGVSEHLHDMNIEQFEHPEGSKLARIALSCGSYKVEDGYAEEIGYYGGGYGAPCVIFYPNKRKMLPFWSIEDAIEVLDGPSYSH